MMPIANAKSFENFYASRSESYQNCSIHTIGLFVFSRHAIVSNKSSDFSALHVPRLHEVQLCTVYMNRDKNLPSAGHYFHLLGCSQPYHTYFPFHDQVIPEITELI